MEKKWKERRKGKCDNGDSLPLSHLQLPIVSLVRCTHILCTSFPSINCFHCAKVKAHREEQKRREEKEIASTEDSLIAKWRRKKRNKKLTCALQHTREKLMAVKIEIYTRILLHIKWATSRERERVACGGRATKRLTIDGEREQKYWRNYLSRKTICVSLQMITIAAGEAHPRKWNAQQVKCNLTFHWRRRTFTMHRNADTQRVRSLSVKSIDIRSLVDLLSVCSSLSLTTAISGARKKRQKRVSNTQWHTYCKCMTKGHC